MIHDLRDKKWVRKTIGGLIATGKAVGYLAIALAWLTFAGFAGLFLWAAWGGYPEPFSFLRGALLMMVLAFSLQIMGGFYPSPQIDRAIEALWKRRMP